MYLKYIAASANPTLVFGLACLAIIPLAGKMGEATEHLAEKLGQGIGGLLNATFGNAAELIITLVAMSKGPAFYPIIKASLTGSIIGNILLVLGASCFAGGLKFSSQRFNRTATRASVTQLTIASIALLIPYVFHQEAGDRWNDAHRNQLSLAIAVVLILTYGAMLLFSLRTHAQLFVGEENDAQLDAEYQAGALAATGEATRRAAQERQGEAIPDKQPETAHWPTSKSIGVLLVATILVALMSEALVGAVEGARQALGFSEVFVGVVVVAIIGNAAEHSTAVLMAMRNKMDLSMGIAIGSSIQIALFVAPVLIFASYAFGHPLDLEFTLPEIAAAIGSVFIVGQVAGDGESNWLEGIQLLSFYIVLAIFFYFLPEMHHGMTAGAAH